MQLGHFLLGIIIGAAVVGSSVQRTLDVGRGRVLGSVFYAFINAVSYYISVKFIVADDLLAYVGTSIGSTILMAYMAYKNNVRG